MKQLGITITDLRRTLVPDDIRSYLDDLLSSISDEIESESDHQENYFGGFFFIVESEEDLDKIMIGYSGYTLKDDAGAFDSVEELSDHFAILDCFNNAGGNTFFVPKSLNARTVLESYYITNPDKRVQPPIEGEKET